MYHIGTTIIKNGKLESLSEQEEIGFDNEVYELMRVENKRVLFVDDHLKRFENTLLAARKWIDNFDSLKQQIEWLVLCNEIENCNLRLTLSTKDVFQAGFVPSSYPEKEDYERGVKTDLIEALRPNPKAKIYHADMRNAAEKQQKDEGLYESLLVNGDGQITEGSRSNVFFVGGGNVYTAPDRMVLGGIVRKKVIDICGEMGVPVIYMPIESGKISEYDAAFITSTPARVLPISEVGEVKYDVDNEVMRQIMVRMEKLVNEN